MDVSQALKDAENTLRDFISERLAEALGPDWVDRCGASAERVAGWRTRRAEDAQAQRWSGTVEDRLIYYADFHDLFPILKKHWTHFAPALGELKSMEVWLGELGKLRNPDAHGRELMPHQKALAVGIAGEIRTRIIRYRSKMETSQDYYPRIETVRDSLGNSTTPPRGIAQTGLVLRPGDVIDYVVTATDPLGEPLLYRAVKTDGRSRNVPWSESNSMRVEVLASDVGDSFGVHLHVISRREFHASQGFDDAHVFTYKVLPPKVQPGPQ